MKKLLLTTVALLLAWAPGSAIAKSTIVPTENPQAFPYQQWVDQAKVPTPYASVFVREAPCDYTADEYDQRLGCIWPSSSLIDIRPAAGEAASHRAFAVGLGRIFNDLHWLTRDKRKLDRAGGRIPFERLYAACALPRKLRPSVPKGARGNCKLIAKAFKRDPNGRFID